MCEQAGSTTPGPDRQVLVVGGSVEGLATAAFLRRAGLSPVVVTPEEAAPGVERDVVLWGSAVALLAGAGVADGFLATATPVRQWVLCRGDGPAERLQSAHTGRWPCVALDRGRLRSHLRAGLPADTVRLSKTPCRLETDDVGVCVEFEDGVRERFDVVVGADGVRSCVRRSRLDDEPVPCGTTVWTVRSARQLGEPETVVERWLPDGTLTCVPPAAGGCLQFVTAAARPSNDADAAVERLSAAIGSTAALDDVPLSALTVVARTVDARVRSERWTAGRAALLGTAARSLPSALDLDLDPSLAVEDAYVLADELASPAPPAEALRRYARRRRGRHRALERHLPQDPPATPDNVRDRQAQRAALLRSTFAERVPAVSGDVSTRL